MDLILLVFVGLLGCALVARAVYVGGRLTELEDKGARAQHAADLAHFRITELEARHVRN